MGIKDGLVAGGMFVCGIFYVVEAVAYLLRGIYTKTFKGTSRREYIHKTARPLSYWFNVAFHLLAGVALIYAGFWFTQSDPTINGWYHSLRSLFTL